VSERIAAYALFRGKGQPPLSILPLSIQQQSHQDKGRRKQRGN
jgi:hypothetical protein